MLNIRAHDAIDIWYYQYEDDLLITLGEDSSITVENYFTADHSGTGLTWGRQNTENVGSILSNSAYSNGLHVNAVFAGASGIGIYQSLLGSFTDASLTSRNSYFDAFRTNYLAFRNSDDVWATHRDNDDSQYSSTFAEGLATLEDMLANRDGSYNVLLGDAGQNKLVGDMDANLIRGSGGADTISGGAGNDLIDGGAGADNLDGGAGFDVLSYEGATNGIVLYFDNPAKGWSSLVADIVNDNATRSSESIENFEGAVGTSLTDIFVGNDDANFFKSGDGFDVLSYEGHSTAVRIKLTEQTSEFIPSPTNYVAGDHISGFEGVIGSDFDDDLNGTAGRNLLEGGAGNDRLSGGDGFDTFVFRAGHGMDRITDFTVGEDKLMFDFGGSVDGFDISVIESANGEETHTRIQTADGGLIDLFGVEIDELGATSFVFV
ncbi:calcium-binding protein [Phaeobacter inhibens]|uniref:calcium-binding protein n=1 Tax=Phaeobacter inhibens TaxID=221822 RepID=UPI00076BB878|nr:hypothetical protein [Phaeobacter inhibens]KXF88794.1 hypothetical protein AT574_20545 [Phaeobacter inhibens]WHP68357.1 hypothetical protein QMZ01_17900 [Phaeobacter inhibens]